MTRALPALLLAQKAQTKAARIGFDWAKSDDVHLAALDEVWNRVKRL